MNFAYVDSSVFLRRLLREPLPEVDLSAFERLYTAQILELECRRVLDRIRIQERIPDEELAQRYLELQEQLQAIYQIRLSQPIFKRSCESFPVVVRSLDSIHLSSFIVVQKTVKPEGKWVFITHDLKLKAAAETLGFETTG